MIDIGAWKVHVGSKVFGEMLVGAAGARYC